MTTAYRILVIEDHQDTRDLLCEILAQEGYTVTAAADAAAALARISERPPDLVLLDVVLRGMRAPEFVRAYRALPVPQAPILVVSAARDVAEGAAALGAADCLERPFELDALCALVRRYADPAPLPWAA